MAAFASGTALCRGSIFFSFPMPRDCHLRRDPPLHPNSMHLLKQRRLQWTFAVDGGGDKTSGGDVSASPLNIEKAQGATLDLRFGWLKKRHIQLSPTMKQPQVGKSLLRTGLCIPQPLLSPSAHCIVWHWDKHPEILLQGKAKNRNAD